MLANVLFATLSPLLIFGVVVPPASVIAGAVFVARDYAHRASPRGIWPAMAAACALSALLADPSVAVASLLAFCVSELLDAVIFTRARGSFARRVVLSSLIAVPIDTVLFLWLALGASIDLAPSAVLVCLSKLIALLVLWSRRAR